MACDEWRAHATSLATAKQPQPPGWEPADAAPHVLRHTGSVIVHPQKQAQHLLSLIHGKPVLPKVHAQKKELTFHWHKLPVIPGIRLKHVLVICNRAGTFICCKSEQEGMKQFQADLLCRGNALNAQRSTE